MSKEVVCIFTWPCIARYWMLRDAVIGVRKSAIVLVRIYQDSIRLDGWYSIEYPSLHMGITNATFIFGIVLVVIGVIIMVLAKRVRT